MTKVFISYSHDSQAHRDFVRGVADQLRRGGLECVIDQYINGFPPEGWLRWMEDQVEVADFVLMVCTETYLRRYRGHETDGGRGVTFEGVVISQTLYDAYYRNTKFVPVLPEGGDFEYVPLPLKQYSTYMLPTDYDNLYRYLTGQPEHIAPPVGDKRVMPPSSNNVPALPPIPGPCPRKGGRETSSTPPPDKIQITKLPHTNSRLFGRETELTMLDNAWANGVNVLTLKAMGGTGKTSLLKHWLDKFVASGYRGAQAVFTWSFYSQGSAENKQVSTDDFFESALRFFGYTEENLPAPHDRGIQLARLVAAQRALLILDGLEPLQHPVGIFHGELKDQGLKALLQQLAASNAGLCLISSRQTVEELRGKPETLVLQHDLEQLQLKDGVELLRAIGVHGSAAELTDAVTEVAGHALALNLLGNYVKTVLKGDIRQRDKIPGLMAERHDGKHAEKMLAAYETHFQSTDVPESDKASQNRQLGSFIRNIWPWRKPAPQSRSRQALSVLYLMGLFDRPVSPGAIQCLQKAKIAGLTDALGDDADWCYAIEDLREQNLLNAVNPDYPENLDCHPLIREYFGRQLQSQQPEAWQQAHECLYAYYKALPEKELPDTLEEMQPLFSAVAHGCAAGLYQQALHEVYWPRIKRKDEHYLTKKLGAFSDNLAAVAHFFTTPWQTPAAGLADPDKAVLLNFAGFGLRALGRLREAVEPMQANIDMNVERENWKSAAVNASNLSELQLTLGDITQAVSSAAQSVVYANKSGDMFQRMVNRTTYADALHQAGQFAQAGELFQVAEVLQQELQAGYPRLYSLQGFQYCGLLLAQGETGEVLERAEQTLGWAKQYLGLLDVALDQLTLGRAHLQQDDVEQAADWLDQAVVGLRAAGTQDHLPRGLLARAALFRHTHDFTRARKDLQEVFDIADGSGMRLFLADYHLEMGRLLLEERDNGELAKPLPSPPLIKGGSLTPLRTTDADKRLVSSLDSHVLPFKRGSGRPRGVAFELLHHHIHEAERLINETGYHRRDAELATLKQQLT